MKTQFKKALSAVLTAAMVFGSCIVANADTTDDVTIFDGSVSTATGYTTDRAAAGKDGSAEIKLAERKSYYVSPSVNDWTDYKTLKINLASKYAYSGKMNVLLQSKDSTGYSIKKNIIVDKKEFNEIEIPISDFADGVSADKVPITNITTVSLYFEGWDIKNENIDSAAVYYLDSIKLSKNEVTEEESVTVPYTDITHSGEYVLNPSGGVPSDCTASTTVKGFANQSAQWAKHQMTFTNVPTGETGLVSYKNLNLLMYNEGATNGTIKIQFPYTKSDNTGGYELVSKTIDWTGWKVLSIPIPNNMATFTGTIYVYGHSGAWSATYKDANTTAYFDKIWLDKADAPVNDTTGGVNMLKEAETNLGNGSPKIGASFSTNSNATLKFDMYVDKTDATRYAAVVLRDETNKANSAKALVLNDTNVTAEKWVEKEYPVSDFGLKDHSNISLYIGENWNVGDAPSGTKPSYVSKTDDAGITVKVKNVRIETPVEYTGAIETKYDATANGTGKYVVLGSDITALHNASVTVTDTTTNTVVTSNAVLAQNKLYFNFDETEGHTYTIAVTGYVDAANKKLDATYTYTAPVTPATEEDVTETKFSVTAPQVTKSATNITATADYVNGSGAAKSATVIVGVYDGNRLVSAKTLNYSNLLSNRRGQLELKWNTGETDYSDKTVKMFVWDGLSTLTPLTTPVTAE